MTSQNVVENYGQNIYAIQLAVASQMYAQYYANQNTLSGVLIDSATTADFCLEAGAVFVQRMLAQPARVLSNG
jgi:hypothetical protein